LIDWKDGFLWFRISGFKRAGRFLWIKKIRDSSNGPSLKERKGRKE
jgi:hypothetical protein